MRLLMKRTENAQVSPFFILKSLEKLINSNVNSNQIIGCH